MVTEIGLFLAGLVICVVIYDILTGRIHQLWHVIFLMVVAIIALGLLSKKIQIFATIIVLEVVGIGTWIWIEELYRRLHGAEIDRFQTRFTRTIVLGLVFASLLLAYIFLFGTKGFFTVLWQVLSTPGLLPAIGYFLVAFLSVVFFFGLIYATIYVVAGPNSFCANRPLKLLDFFYFSFVTFTTIGSPDITPRHKVALVVSIVQVLCAIIVVSIYLGAIFSYFVPK